MHATDQPGYAHLSKGTKFVIILLLFFFLLAVEILY